MSSIMTHYFFKWHWSPTHPASVSLGSKVFKFYLVYRFGRKDQAYHEFTLGKSYIYLCSTLTMRGWNILPSKPAAQLALFSLLFFGTLMFWHWEAMLISYLASRVIVMPFNDIADLVSNTDFRINLTPNTSFMDAFQFSKNPDWQAAWIQR